MNLPSFLAALIASSVLGTTSAMAALQLGDPFGEHMVLQQGVPVPIWGSGCPGGESVRLSFYGQNLTTKCDWAGRWMFVLAPMNAGGPFQLLMQIGGFGLLMPSSAATAKGGIELNDVVIGEVRLLAPHTESVSGSRCADESRVPETSAWVRVYHILKVKTDGSGGSTSGQWVVAVPGTPIDNSDCLFSCGRQLYRKLKVPVGVIETPTRH